MKNSRVFVKIKDVSGLTCVSFFGGGLYVSAPPRAHWSGPMRHTEQALLDCLARRAVAFDFSYFLLFQPSIATYKSQRSPNHSLTNVQALSRNTQVTTLFFPPSLSSFRLSPFCPFTYKRRLDSWELLLNERKTR